MNFSVSDEDLGQLGRGLVALQGFERHLRLEIRLELVPSGCHEHLQDASVLNLKSVSSFRGPLQFPSSDDDVTGLR